MRRRELAGATSVTKPWVTAGELVNATGAATTGHAHNTSENYDSGGRRARRERYILQFHERYTISSPCYNMTRTKA